MGYKRMTKEDIYEILRRWHAGQNVSRIVEVEKCDRKTIFKYIKKFNEAGFGRDTKLPDKERIWDIFEQKILPSVERHRPASKQLEPLEDIIRDMVQDKKEPLKPKSVYSVLKNNHNVNASYETYKIFVRNKGLTQKPARQMIRIELPAGLETQIDYGKVGLLEYLRTGKNKVVWAFCGVLAHSRLPFIQFVYTQDQKSFVESFIDMFEYYGGVTEIQSIDNLKSGVITPDLYDPKLNKSLQEMIEYYGTFIDPCRVGKATDKGKIERMIPSARELFRVLKKIHPTADIHTLNEHALRWCTEEYGQREHGTTRMPPMEVFEETERETLKKLPEERFEAPIWKPAHVHRGDQFFSFDKLRYSLPEAYKGLDVWVRYTERNKMLRVFLDRRLIREYVVTGKAVNYVPEDFPEGKREMMDGGFPRYLRRKAQVFGEASCKLIESILEPHAYLNCRRAQGILAIMKEYRGKPFYEQVCRRALQRGVKLPRTFKAMLKVEEKQLVLDMGINISELGRQMVRDATYYTN
ncbi:MAG TPA: IS21 family transposase [Candidatus Aminicenantes bacterium]|nr:IS21 family transposase [Candidatus Aminicenantes bacterium]